MTETDRKCEALVLGRIRAAFPDHKFIGEEGSAAQASAVGTNVVGAGKRSSSGGWVAALAHKSINGQ